MESRELKWVSENMGLLSELRAACSDFRADPVPARARVLLKLVARAMGESVDSMEDVEVMSMAFASLPDEEEAS